jgi:hypothetical protein
MERRHRDHDARPAGPIPFLSFLVVLLNAVENQLSDMPKGPKAREIAIGTLGLLIGTLQLARAVDDPSLSKNILAAGRKLRECFFRVCGFA